ncbi:MarR family transcriptional regulator [Demequina sp. SYSU T00039]|uniref:MarR family transcriptional regulator n=1 Tax=Demequina lignilytica TaxID=3051663 RepID=A0AAW7M7P2_9MICO|nr:MULTISPECIES: MarR family transcriptional regulator [unclassified Demequina]MDN4478398.1 MarR family transcriptional regulator [Demequina sp. SYSU T00039-1]MDN4487095.1 MarR family transcriptional regulator [Demequina sp. SYSU T00039]MDN4489806.1 MarR family transcriptional regulator [Demequina sp. SYSU T00068]
MTATAPAAAPARARSHLANDAWEATMAAHATLMRRFAAEDLWSDVSMREYDVLYTLSKCDEPQRLSELGRHVLLSQPALSRLVDRLVERGLVARCADPSDARAAHLTLTPTGRDLQRRIGRRHGASVARAMTAALTEEELTLLESLTHKLSQEHRS